jgi:periplasmic divalent cation tolerance protein
MNARVILSTATSLVEAKTIARTMVEEHLAACVNIIPGASSIYRWQGAIHEDAEWILLIKSSVEQLPGLEARLRSLHSADVPEFLVLVPESGSKDYLLWMDEALQQPGC